MSGYAEDYAKEEQLYTLYMRKAEHHKKRMESIKYLMDGSVDELDAAAASMLIENAGIGATSGKGDVREATYRAAIDDQYPKKRMSDKTIQLFQFIGLEGKALPKLTNFADEKALGWKDHNIRNMMMQYRKNYGFIESPRNGFYQLTQKGLDAINKQLVEDKGEL